LPWLTTYLKEVGKVLSFICFSKIYYLFH
jgi:hypothetical protein